MKTESKRRSPSRAGDARTLQMLRSILAECVAWMDAPHRETPLQQSLIQSARVALAATERR